MLVADWMTRDPFTIGPETRLGTAAALMVKRKVRRIPVVAPQDRLVGVVTKSDLLGAAPARLNPFSPEAESDALLDAPVRTFMASTPITIAAESPIEAAAQLMIDHKVGGLPVLRGQRLVGIVTESDVFRALTAAMGSTSSRLRVTFELTQGEDVVAMVVKLANRFGQRVNSVATYTCGDKSSAVVRLEGPESQGFLDELWKTGHRVESVLRVATTAAIAPK